MSQDDPNAFNDRSGARKHFRSDVTLRVSDEPIAGVSDNLSPEGIMFFTQDDLRVSVEFEDQGGKVQRSGRLVRINRMGPLETGFAVEFDPE